MPAYSIDGTLQSLQLIPPSTGQKMNLKSSPIIGGRFIVGNVNPDKDIVCVCEGVGQAWACWQASGYAAVVSFGVGNMRRIATDLRKQYPNITIIMVPDVGKERESEKIAINIGGVVARMPDGEKSNFDVNDFARREGYDVLAEILEKAAYSEILVNQDVTKKVQCNDKKPKTMRVANDLATDYISALDARFNGEKHHIPSGFKTLDKRMPGWLHEGHLIIVAGRPAMGKSAFAQQIAEAVAAQQRTAIFFTLEMSGYEITERAIARRSGISIPTLKTAENMGNEDWSKISSALAEFAPLPLLVDDASFDIAALVNKTKAAVAGLAQAGLPPPWLHYRGLLTAYWRKSCKPDFRSRPSY